MKTIFVLALTASLLIPSTILVCEKAGYVNLYQGYSVSVGLGKAKEDSAYGFECTITLGAKRVKSNPWSIIDRWYFQPLTEPMPW